MLYYILGFVTGFGVGLSTATFLWERVVNKGQKTINDWKDAYEKADRVIHVLTEANRQLRGLQPTAGLSAEAHPHRWTIN